MKKLLAIFTFLLIGSREVLASDYFYYKAIDGMVNNQNECYPFCESEVPSVGNVSLSIPDGVTMESDEYFREIDFDIVVRDGANLSDVIITQGDLDVDNVVDSVVVDKDSKKITINRSESNVPGSTKLTITAKIGNSVEYEEDFSITIASSCDNPIDKDGYIILCDSSQNYLISSEDDLLHLSYNQGDSSIGSRIRSGKYKLTNDIYFDIKTKVTKSYDEDGFLDDIQTEVIYNNVDWDGDGNIDDITTEGWIPLGIDDSNKFTGTFYGDEYNIGNLYINRPDTNNQGFFGSSTGVRVNDLGIVNAVIKGYTYTGILTASRGVVYNCYVSGILLGNDNVGGLSGYVYRVYDSYTNVDIIGNNKVGGISGHSDNSVIIENSYAVGDIYGREQVGGILGYGRNANLNNSYATGNVKGTYKKVGGLIGYNGSCPIVNSYATGNVKALSGEAGGLVGYNVSFIGNSYASGDVIGTGAVGGLVGTNTSSGAVLNSYAIGSVSGNSSIGGLVGSNAGSIANADNKCAYTNGDLSICTNSDAISLKTDLSNGVWDDDIWEDLQSLTPRLEWEVAGNIASNMVITKPAVCEYDNPLEDIAQSGGYYIIGNNADETIVNDSALAKQQLLCISNYQTANVKEANYRLAADVIFNADYAQEDWNGDGLADGSSTEGWNPISSYKGTIDGDNYEISNLYINRPNNSYQGFIGDAEKGLIELGFKNVNITAKSNVGALVGFMPYGIQIRDCYVDGGVITASGSYVGALSGNVWYIADSYSTATVNGLSYVGGLTGYARYLYRNYTTGNVTGTGSYIGGLAGNTSWGYGDDNYTSGNVTGLNKVGGLIGMIHHGFYLRRGYASGVITGSDEVGGLVGNIYGVYPYGREVVNSYFVGSVAGTGSKVGSLIGYLDDPDGVYPINNEDDLCEYVGTIGVCSLANALEIQAGATTDYSYGAWSTNVWNLDGTAIPELATE